MGKEAGLRAVREASGTKWAEVAGFLEIESLPVVVKPVESAGSDGVMLCRTKQEAEAHFHLLMNAQRKVGSQGAAVLVQEFLKGKEYVVDHVSRDGVHKTVGLWVYDKRPCNGAQFVYYGKLPVPSTSEVAQKIIPYVRSVLDALQIKHGPTHGEVMMTNDGPCLVEMNCRTHGGDGVWIPLARALHGGYSQVDVALDASLDLEAFAKVPDVPPFPFKASGVCLDLINMREGLVTGTPGFDRIRSLPSFVSLESGIQVGMHVERTIDMFTSPGGVVLTNKDEKALERDVAVIRQMETDCTLLQYEEHGEVLARPRTTSESTTRERLGSNMIPQRRRTGSLLSDKVDERRSEDLQISRTAAVGWVVAIFSMGALAGAALSRRRS